ncbi:UMP-CMP kinase 2, mitochondrial-like [Homalodisca vitripennis]|uniref:UMP-CMP kinase 2, mitochondrial-like n=1 Tax=Homalodisca vitripennis TaxID=197043 RepID=UPI001EE9E3C1|nr:UMP-CMP kinase 2, mitochondrial-like [Homalodisca vitripennis]
MNHVLESTTVCLFSLFIECFSYYSEFDSDVTEPPGRINEIGACYSLSCIMNTFNKSEYRSLPQVRDLLETYHYNCYLRDMNSVSRRHVFIVIEAPRRRKRFLIAKRLGKALGAAVMFSPPVGWGKFRGFFNKTIEMRRAFHSLSLYGTANNALQYLGRRPVVMSGFWLDQATFSIAKKYYPDLPPPESSIFQWPKDLLKPDFTFFVNEPLPRAFIKKREESIRYQILQVYRRWVDPPITELYVDNDIGIPAVVEEMLTFINNPALTPSSLRT